MVRKVYTAKNGAKYIKLANGQCRFIKGASKKYLNKIRKRKQYGGEYSKHENLPINFLEISDSERGYINDRLGCYSLKYNRVNDSGYLIARIFINKDKHFFVEGDKEVGFLFNNFINEEISINQINKIIDVLMMYSLNFDLQTPNFNDVREVFIHQILDMSNNQKIRTSKRMGYKFSFETNNE